MKKKNEEAGEVKKTKTYAFWMSVSSACLLVVVQILSIFGINISSQSVSEIISGVLGALVVAGILIGPIKDEEENKTEEDSEGKDK